MPRLHPSNLLATRGGRSAAFFLLYVSEGIPYGFTVTAVATQMRRQGLGPAEIGVFVGALYLPWALKWAAGPLVDVLRSKRFGHYRAWILFSQIGLVAALLAAMPVDFARHFQFFTALLLLHNAFGAVQDVAIDALAVNVLLEHERGTANGFMWAGYAIGQAIGGSGVLFLTQVLPFQSTYFLAAAAITAILVWVVLPLREPPAGNGAEPEASGTWRLLASRIHDFVRATLQAFASHRGAWVAVLYALVPTGAYALGLALQSNIAVDLGFSDVRIATLTLCGSIVGAVGCLLGGWLSDRFGRRRMVGLFVVLMSIPTLFLAWAMQQSGWQAPVAAPAGLVVAFWWAVMLYQFTNGLMYSSSCALYMDVTTPRVAATQYTAYMAIANLCIAYSAAWQGISAERFGYSTTLVLDGLFGLVGLALLPLLTPLPAKLQHAPGHVATAAS